MCCCCDCISGGIILYHGGITVNGLRYRGESRFKAKGKDPALSINTIIIIIFIAIIQNQILSGDPGGGWGMKELRTSGHRLLHWSIIGDPDPSSKLTIRFHGMVRRCWGLGFVRRHNPDPSGGSCQVSRGEDLVWGRRSRGNVMR